MSKSKPVTETVELHRFPEATDLPLIHYRGAIAEEGKAAAKAFEQLFARNDWPGAWRNGIYPYHHFHAAAHEVLGIAAGRAAVRFGGPDGPVVEVRAGDVVVIPAGVSHCNEGSSDDLLVVGSYPKGQHPDINKGTPGENARLQEKIAKVALPAADPVHGAEGPLARAWAGRSAKAR